MLHEIHQALASKFLENIDQNFADHQDFEQLVVNEYVPTVIKTAFRTQSNDLAKVIDLSFVAKSPSQHNLQNVQDLIRLQQKYHTQSRRKQLLLNIFFAALPIKLKLDFFHIS